MIYFSTLMMALFVTLSLIPPLKAMAVRCHAVDLPNERKVHCTPIPKIGGIAMAIGAVMPVLLWAVEGVFAKSIIAGASVIVIFGFLDDIFDLPYLTKFAAQIVSALIVVLFGGLQIHSLGNLAPENFLLPQWGAVPLTVFVIVGVTNAINLSDGLDGLAGGITLMTFVCIGYLAFRSGDFFGLTLSAGVIGAIFGFLRFNTHPAIIFMGDTGSQFLGFLAICLSIALTQSSVLYSPLLPLILLGFPILDTLTVMAERIARGRPPFEADKNHFHHKLMRLGLYHSEAVIVIYFIQTFLVASAFIFRYQTERFLIFYYGLFSGCILAFFHNAVKDGWVVRRYPLIDHVIKGKFRVLREKHLLIKVSHNIVRFGLPSLFVFSAVMPATIPRYFAIFALVMAIGLLAVIVMKGSAALRALRIATYLVIPYLVFLSQTDHVGWMTLRAVLVYDLSYGILVFFVIITLKFTRRKKGFKATPMDYLILLIALVVPNLSGLELRDFSMGLLAVKIIVMLFSYEVLAGEMRQNLDTLAYPTIGGLLVIFARGVLSF